MADLWDDHDSYWRNNYSTRPYATGRTYDDLRGGLKADSRGRTWRGDLPALQRLMQTEAR